MDTLHQDYLSTITDVIARGPFKDDWDSLCTCRVPAWYEDAKIGIFIHWGVYSVPAFRDEWYPRHMYTAGTDVHAHHTKTYGPPDRFGYKDLIPLFKAERFDPAAWAALFREAGARFVMPVAEHHDGFQMYASDLSPFNSVQMGPKRDVLGELKEAVEAQGLVFAASSHRAEHYFFFDEGRKIASDVNDPALAGLYGPAKSTTEHHDKLNGMPEGPEETAFLEDWLVRSCELVDRYRPRIVYFDWWIQTLAFKPYLKRFAAYYYNRAAEWGIEVAINYKHDAFMYGSAVMDVERGQLASIRSLFWQTCTAVAKNSWCHTLGNTYKRPEEIVADFVDIVSKNGALLLNFGPKADGEIPAEDQAILRALGTWMKTHGEGIYGTRHWKIFGEGPTQVTEGRFAELQRRAFTTEDIRFTFKPGRLFAFVLRWPESGEVVIRSLGLASPHYLGIIRSVSLLGDPRPVEVFRDADTLSLHVVGLQTGFPVGFQLEID